MKRKGIGHFLNNFDWLLFIAAMLATAMGMVLIYSASLSGGTSARDVLVQSVALIGGLIMMIVICLID